MSFYHGDCEIYARRHHLSHRYLFRKAMLKHRTPNATAIAMRSIFAKRLDCGGSPPLSLLNNFIDLFGIAAATGFIARALT